jgi:hypothetical protein
MQESLPLDQIAMVEQRSTTDKHRSSIHVEIELGYVFLDTLQRELGVGDLMQFRLLDPDGEEVHRQTLPSTDELRIPAKGKAGPWKVLTRALILRFMLAVRYT